MNAREYYAAGQLQEAIQAGLLEVAGDAPKLADRVFLAELQCIAGELSEADQQLALINQQDPKWLVEVSHLRHLIRAEQQRRDCFLGTGCPDFVQTFAESEILLEVVKQISLNNAQAASQLLTQLSPSVMVRGKVNDQDFQEMRDLDDICALFCEVLAANGKYYWIPYAQIVMIDFGAPQRPLDLLWRPAHLKLVSGTEGDLYIPAIYPTDVQDDEYKLGRKTDWFKVGDLITNGVGQRMLMFDQNDYPIMEITSIMINQDEK